MAFDPHDPQQFNNLSIAVAYSRWRLQPFRERRFKILSEFVGYWYSETGADDRVPVNLLQLASNVYLRQLISRAPRAMVSSENPLLKPLAADMESWMNKATEKMGLAESLRMFVFDGLVSMGVMKCGAAATSPLEVDGYEEVEGEAFAERVDLDDWVHDITARRPGQCGYMGNRYRVPLKEAQDNPLFDKKARQALAGMTRYAYNERGEPRVSTLSQSTLQFIDEYEEHVELWDLWLPREKLVVTMPYQESVEGGYTGPPLRVVNWKGPKEGPFILLGFMDVPNNVMPAAPAQAWMDLHLLTNRVLRKVGRQSDRQKTILVVRGPNTEDGERTVRANDGDVIRGDGGREGMAEVRLGGADRDQMLFHEQLRAIFNVVSGNIEAIGGLSPQSHTLGQDELLNKQSSAQVAEMQDRVMTAIRKVYQHLAYWSWQDPVKTLTASRQAHGIQVPVEIPPEVRSIPFDALDFDIDPYSMQEDTPGTRAGKLMQLLQTLLLPLAPQLAQEGKTIDWDTVFNLLARYMDFPDLLGVIKSGPPPQMQGAAQMAQGASGSERPLQSPITSRTNVRKNVPSMSNRGMNQVMQQLAAGATPNPHNGVVATPGR